MSNKGTIFKYDVAGAAHTTLYSFNTTQGAEPLARLIQAQDGKLYGTANLGGANSFGTAFSWDIGGATLSVIRDFAGTTNGKFPNAALVQTVDGKLYAFCYQGGSQDKGTAVSLSGASFGTLTLLHEFADLSLFGGVNNALQLVHAFDANGNRVQVDTWWGPLGYGYDSLNRPTALSDPGFSPAGKASGNTGWQYDSRGQLLRQDNPNGTISTYTYDADGNESEVVHRKADGTLLARAAYTRDSLGNPLTKQTLAGMFTYTYDNLYRLKSENNPTSGLTTWTYDADGNRLTETKGAAVTNYTHDAAGQLASTSGGSGTTNYSYDNNGNRILSQPPSGAPTTFTWDTADRMAVNKLPNGKIVTNTYRYDDLRYGRQGQSGTDGQMWDGDALIAWSRKDNAGSTANQPAQAFTGPADGPELGRALGTQTGAGLVGVERQYHTDEQGTVLAISDDSQASAVTYQTDAWGNVQSGSAADQPLDYAGGLGYQRDPDSNLEYVRARYLDPTTGEWLSQDPILGEPPYAYVYNSPTALTDASGLIPVFGLPILNALQAKGATRKPTPQTREQRLRQTASLAAGIGGMLIPGRTPRGKMGTILVTAEEMDGYAIQFLNSMDRPSYKLAVALSKKPTDPTLIAQLRRITTPQGQAAIIRKADELAREEDEELIGPETLSETGVPILRNKKTGQIRLILPSQAIPYILYGPEGAKALERDKGMRSTIEKSIYSLIDPQNATLALATGGIAGAYPVAGRILATGFGGVALYQGAEKAGQGDFAGSFVDTTVGLLGVGHGYVGVRTGLPNLSEIKQTLQGSIVAADMRVATSKGITDAAIVSPDSPPAVEWSGQRYGPHLQPGPLEYNKKGVRVPPHESLAYTFRSGSYTKRVAAGKLYLYRVFGGKTAEPLGVFWTSDVPIASGQFQMDAAILPEWGNKLLYVVEIEVPVGTTYFEGSVGPQLSTKGRGRVSLLGGGNQAIILDVQRTWKVKIWRFQ